MEGKSNEESCHKQCCITHIKHHLAFLRGTAATAVLPHSSIRSVNTDIRQQRYQADQSRLYDSHTEEKAITNH